MVSRAEKKLFLNAMVAESNDDPEELDDKEEHEEDNDVKNALGNLELPPFHPPLPHLTTPHHQS